MDLNDTIVSRAYTIPKIIKEPESEKIAQDFRVAAPVFANVVDDMRNMLDQDLTRTA